MNLFDTITKGDGSPAPVARQRIVPSQPADTPVGKVYVGSDLGWIDFTGEKPQPGDLIVIIGPMARRVTMTGQEVHSLREPIFSHICRCRCPGNNGLVFYLAFAKNTPAVHAIDGLTGDLLRIIGRQELGYSCVGATFSSAVAVDPDPPHNVYILDDRRNFFRVRTNAAPTVQRGYFGVATFVQSGGEYVFSDFDQLTDPYSGSVFPPATEPDPPAIPGNCLSVPDGLPLITMRESPARYLSLSGGVFTTHTLTLDGMSYTKKLRGNIVGVPDRPAKQADRYVIATSDEVTFEILQFNVDTDEITRVISLDISTKARQLSVVCNRMLLLTGTLNTFASG